MVYSQNLKQDINVIWGLSNKYHIWEQKKPFQFMGNLIATHGQHFGGMSCETHLFAAYVMRVVISYAATPPTQKSTFLKHRAIVFVIFPISCLALILAHCDQML